MSKPRKPKTYTPADLPALRRKFDLARKRHAKFVEASKARADSWREAKAEEERSLHALNVLRQTIHELATGEANDFCRWDGTYNSLNTISFGNSDREMAVATPDHSST